MVREKIKIAQKIIFKQKRIYKINYPDSIGIALRILIPLATEQTKSAENQLTDTENKKNEFIV